MMWPAVGLPQDPRIPARGVIDIAADLCNNDGRHACMHSFNVHREKMYLSDLDWAPVGIEYQLGI